MKKVKQVNIVFMMSALMPYIAYELLSLTGFRVKGSLQQILFSGIVYAFPAIIYLIMSKMTLRTSLRINKIKLSNVILLIVFAFVVTPLMSFVNAISLVFSDNMISSTITDISENNPLILAILAVGVMPALLEEGVYRGVLYNEYRKANPKVAIILSALLFGLLHQNLNQFSYAFLLGIIFALLIEATDSIVSTMIVHCVINTNSVIMTYLLPKLLKAIEKIYGSDFMNAQEVLDSSSGAVDRITMIHAARSMIIPAVISAILSFIIYRTIAKNEGRYENVKGIFVRKEDTRYERVVSFISVPLIIGVAICVFNIISNLIA